MSYGAVVGRFQVPELSAGHKLLIDEAYSHHEHVIIFIGDVDSTRNQKYPMSYAVRKQMIEWHYPDAIFHRLQDHPQDHIWEDNLDAAVENLSNGEGVTFYVGRDSFAKYYHGENSIVVCDFGINHVSGTEIRKKCKEYPRDHKFFREGIIHSIMTDWPRAHTTVDMALTRNVWGGRQVCMIRKEGSDKWGFPGGFVDIDETFAEAAQREMREETGLESHTGWINLQDFILEDWRVRGIPNVGHRTVLMRGTTDAKAVPRANDDVVDAKFFFIDILYKNREELVSRTHIPLLESLVSLFDEVDTRYPKR